MRATAATLARRDADVRASSFSFKNPFDPEDMRTTAGGDAAYDIDFPARDDVLAERGRCRLPAPYRPGTEGAP
jgi:hypothetical protein